MGGASSYSPLSDRIRILNGRVNGDSLGRTPFHGKNGVHVVDYAICDQDIFSLVANFIVKEPLYLSDHSPEVIVLLKTNNKIGSSHTIPERDILSRLPKQFLWENDSTQKFKDALRSLNIQALIREYTADDSLNENAEKSLEKLESILITTAKCCLKIKTGKTRRSIKLSSNKK